MAITLFVFLFSIAFLTLIGVMFHIKKIPTVVFASLLTVLVVLDFALLSMDKIYYLHQEQDSLYSEKLRIYDEKIANQVEIQRSLSKMQLDMALQSLSVNSAQETEESIQQKVVWREKLLRAAQDLKFDEAEVTQISTSINASIHKYLMEALNKQVIQSLGHRVYSEFVRSRPRQEWTDELFVAELQVFLIKHKQESPELMLAIKRINEFKSTGLVLKV
jgi:hypothetical protein